MQHETTILRTIENEFDRIPFSDKRHSTRLKLMATEFWDSIGATIPHALKGWAETKAAYRFFSNPEVDDNLIQHGHFLNTVERIKKDAESKLIVVQDTSMLNFESHPRTSGLGSIGNVSGKRQIQGLHFHSSLVFNSQRLPLGLLEQEVWPRKLRRDKKKLYKIPVELKESGRWRRSIELAEHVQKHSGKHLVVVSDREGDLNHQMIEAFNKNVGFVIRGRNARSCFNQGESIQVKKHLKAQGFTDQIKIEIKSRKKRYLNKTPRKSTAALHIRETEETREVTLSLHWKKVIMILDNEDGTKLQKEIGAIWAHEITPQGRPKYAPISWLLLTNEPLETVKDVETTLNIYRIRWEIEVYHRILKSGCKVEDCRLSEGKRLSRYLLIMGIVAWRIQFLTNLAKTNSKMLAKEVFEEDEILALQLKLKLKRSKTWTLKEALIRIATLGGFMGRKSDKHPGPTSLWRGLQQLTFLAEGVRLGRAS